MPLIKNPEFSNQRIVIGSYVVQFNEEGVAEFPDAEVVKSLLQIPGFSLVEPPAPSEKVKEEQKELPKEEEEAPKRPRRKEPEAKE